MLNNPPCDLLSDRTEEIGFTDLPTRSRALCVGNDLDTGRFYIEVLGCSQADNNGRCVNFDLHGHLIACELGRGRSDQVCPSQGTRTVEMPDFSATLELNVWNALLERLTSQRKRLGTALHVRFTGHHFKQKELLVFDPWGNALEFKASPLHGTRGYLRTWHWLLVALIVGCSFAALIYTKNSLATAVPTEVPPCLQMNSCKF
jgi:extradiol dioxygenase family protein